MSVYDVNDIVYNLALVWCVVTLLRAISYASHNDMRMAVAKIAEALVVYIGIELVTWTIFRVSEITS